MHSVDLSNGTSRATRTVVWDVSTVVASIITVGGDIGIVVGDIGIVMGDIHSVFGNAVTIDSIFVDIRRGRNPVASSPVKELDEHSFNTLHSFAIRTRGVQVKDGIRRTSSVKISETWTGNIESSSLCSFLFVNGSGRVSGVALRVMCSLCGVFGAEHSLVLKPFLL